MDSLLLKAIQIVRESTGPMRFVADWQEKLKAKGNDISQLDPNEATELLELIKGLSTTQLGDVFKQIYDLAHVIDKARDYLKSRTEQPIGDDEMDAVLNLM